ncbi:MAG: ornithine carbamoyltransferase [Vulcanimicrobiaceae bacterium]
MYATPLAPANPLQGRSFLEPADLSTDELGGVLRLAHELKAGVAPSARTLLRGRTLALLFEKPSLRTRVSFEVAITTLGGEALFATGNEMLVGTRESPEDAARVLSRYVDAIVVRTHAHEPLERFARAASIPVINGLSARAHPCQALADILTIEERFGSVAGLRVVYLGDGRNNVAHSLAQAVVMLGGSMRFATPLSHRPSQAMLAHLAKLGAGRGGEARAFTDPIRALRGADVVYTDVWTSMGDEHLHERNNAMLLPYAVTQASFTYAASHAIFMHCLPAHRGQEVAAGVIDGTRSLVFDQAENRLHAQKALLLALMTDGKGTTL